MKRLPEPITLICLVAICSSGVASAQTDSVHAVPLDSAPHLAAPPPVSAKVMEYKEALMPNGHAAFWVPCGPGSARMDVCDTLVRRIKFDPDDGQLRAWSCRNDSIAQVTPFLVEQRDSDVMLNLPTRGRQYIMSRPNRCRNSCKDYDACLRLTKLKKKRTDPDEVIYLRLDTTNPQP